MLLCKLILVLIVDEVLLYIRNLEDRVGQLEAGSEYPLSTHFPQPFRSKIVKDLSLDHINDNIDKDLGSRPESVTNAMKVLEVHEQILEKSLDSDEASDELGDGEKALVREMCNVSTNECYAKQRQQAAINHSSSDTISKIPISRLCGGSSKKVDYTEDRWDL